MSNKNIDDYIQEGIYGPKETNPDERRVFLGSLRERVILVLKQSEVRGEKGLNELEKEMKNYPNAKLLINGDMNFRFFKPYRELARNANITYTSVNDQESTTEYGLVLTMDHAIDKEDIFLHENKTKEEKQEKKSWWQKLFG
ncbi:YueI family protein [Gracilibacillus oryzae]|uniref:YueI family protein n=1 Tax=Gracilibacillus oryzae TaxID=1672701 RepID=A0A7C8KTC8_9BACI|nr:YueI family protein [Gracilibacillus oryzae]KAB8137921.1 YueI family protein [Gracilibacillus oryzae]